MDDEISRDKDDKKDTSDLPEDSNKTGTPISSTGGEDAPSSDETGAEEEFSDELQAGEPSTSLPEDDIDAKTKE